jgi:hypothetical protein
LQRLTCRDENPIGNWTLKIKDSKKNFHTGVWNSWSITFWGASSKPQVILPHNRNKFIINPSDMLKNNTQTPENSISIPVHESIISIIFGILCLVTMVFGVFAAKTFWDRVTKNQARSNLANEDRYIPIEDELDDAFLESQLREMIDEDI